MSVLAGVKEMRRKLIRGRMEAEARRNSQRFWCVSLAGQADYGLEVLSDMMVSCTCSNYAGDTMLGNLSQQSLEECINGEKARRIKESLAQGRLSLLSCVVCMNLKRCSVDEAEQHAKEHALPRQGLLVENTVLCNIDCVDCPRVHAVKLRSRMSMSDEDMEKVAREAGRLNLKRLMLVSDGEPFLPKGVLNQVRVLRRHNPAAFFGTSTNGLLLDSDEKREAALLFDEIMFSIHGCTEESYQRYMRKGSFEKAYRNMKDLVAYRNGRSQTGRPEIEWKYVLFNWNDRKELIQRAVRMAEEAGIDRIGFVPTARPATGYSWRYRYGSFLRQVGKIGSKGLGREVVFPSSWRAAGAGSGSQESPPVFR